MAYGPRQYFAATMASGGSTAALDMGDKSFRQMAVYMPTMSTGAALTVYGSADGSVYAPVFERVNTAPVQYQALTIATAASGAWNVIQCPPFRYIAFAASAVVANGTTIKVMVDD